MNESRRRREALGVVGLADDLEPLAHELAIIADFERAEPLGRRVVEEDVGSAPQIVDVARRDVPGKTPSAEVRERVDDGGLLRPGRQRDVHEGEYEVVGALDAGRRAHALDAGLRKLVHEIEVGCVLRGDPEIGREVLDGDGRVVEDADEQADLHENQADRKSDAGHRDEVQVLVVKQASYGGEVDR
jgi:hypothetical protein